jgi:hypothetical protein
MVKAKEDKEGNTENTEHHVRENFSVISEFFSYFRVSKKLIKIKKKELEK